MIDGQDRLEVLEEKLLYELLKERFEPIFDGLGFHNRSADALKIGKNRTKAPGELIRLIAGLANCQRSLALLAVHHLRTKPFDRLQIQPDLNNQATEALRDILVQTGQPLKDEQRPHSHVDGNSQPILFLLEPPPCRQARIELASNKHCLVASVGSACKIGAAKPTAAGGNDLG